MTGEMERVLLEGRLHPGAIVIDSLKTLRKTGIYVALLALQFWLTKQQVLTAFFAFAFVVGSVVFLGVPVLRFLRFRYRLTDESLYITSGIVSRKQRRIPLDRVQDVSSEADLAHRLLGVVKLNVQTSSTAGVEAELDCLSVADAEALTKAIGARSEPRSTEAQAVDPKPHLPEWVYRAPLRHIVLRGLTDNRAGVIVLTVLAVVERGLDFRAIPAVAFARDTIKRTVGDVVASGLATSLGLGLLLGIAVFVTGWIASAVTNAVRFHGFSVHESRGVFHRRYGLLTQRLHALPRQRIQAFRIEQTLLRRAVGLATTSTDDMGSGAHDKTAEAAGVDVFVPAAPVAVAFALAPRIFPDLRPGSLSWHRTSPTVVRRSLFVGSALGLLLGTVGAFMVGWWALTALALPLGFGVLGKLRHRHLGWAWDGLHLAVREGVITRRHAFAPVHKIQALSYVQNPFDRRWRVGKLVAVLGGGSWLVIPNLPDDDARGLLAGMPAGLEEAPAPAAMAINGEQLETDSG